MKNQTTGFTTENQKPRPNTQNGIFSKLAQTAACMAVLFSLSPLAQAQRYGNGNGGDGLELEFENYRSQIQTWIEKTALRGIDLGQTPAATALQKLKQVLQAGRVKFTDIHQKIATQERTCINYPAQAQIVCNRARFQKESEDSRFVLVFHEYLGLAGLESNDGDRSNYKISSQLRDYFVKRETISLSLSKQSLRSKATDEKGESGILVDSAEYTFAAAAVVCRNYKGTITEAELLDYYEGRTEKGYNFDKAPDGFTDPFALAQYRINRIKELGLIELGGKLKPFLDQLDKSIVIQEGLKRATIKESLPIHFPTNCKIEQLAVQRDTSKSTSMGTKTFLIEKEIWENLPLVHQAGVITHMVFLNYYTKKNYDEFDGIRATANGGFNYYSYIKSLVPTIVRNRNAILTTSEFEKNVLHAASQVVTADSETFREWQMKISGDFKGVNLKGTVLKDLIFENSNLDGVDFSGSTLDRIQFNSSSLNGADFSGSKIQDLYFERSKLNFARFQNSKIRLLTIRTCTAEGLSLHNVEYIDLGVSRKDHFEFFNTLLDNADFSNAKIDQLHINDSSLKNANFHQALLVRHFGIANSDAQGADFTESNLSNAHFSDSNLSNSRWNQAKVSIKDPDSFFQDRKLLLTGADFRSAKIRDYNGKSALPSPKQAKRLGILISEPAAKAKK